MVPFGDLDDAQRLEIAHEHPTDLDSSQSSPSLGSLSYLRPHRHSKSTTRHRSHTTADGSTSHLLARLLARDDEIREVKAHLIVTSDRLETESTRANTAERRALEYFARLRSATESRERAEQDSARLAEELRMYKLQLDNAQKEIFRAQDIINAVSAQKDEAEAEAARARTKARKLHEEKVMMLAREEGRQQGYKEGLSIGRRLGYEQGTRVLRPSNESRRRRRQHEVDETEENENDEEEDIRQELDNIRSRTPPVRTRTRASNHSLHNRSESAPPVRTYDTAPHAPTLPVPTLVTPIPVPSPSHAPRPGFTPPPGSPVTGGPETIRHIPYRTSAGSPSRRSPDIPPDGWIPRQDPHNSYIPVPPPHELSQPVPTSPSTRSHELDGIGTRQSSQSGLYTRDPNYPAVRTRDYAYPPAGPPLQVPRPRTPSVVPSTISRSSTHVSQYDLVSAPTERRPGSSLRNEYDPDRSRSSNHSHSERARGESRHRSPAERMVEQWRADPDVVSTVTPVFNNTNLAPYAGPRRPREIVMPAPLADANDRSNAEISHPPNPLPPPPIPVPPPERIRSPLDYFRQRFRQREQSSNSIPNIVVESPSESGSNGSEHTVGNRPELLSPDSANRVMPLPGETTSQDARHHHQQHHHQHQQQQQTQQHQQPRPATPVSALPLGFQPLSEPSTASLRSSSRADQRSDSRGYRSDSRAGHRSDCRGGYRTESRARDRKGYGEQYELAPIPDGVAYPGPPGRPANQPAPREVEEDYFSHREPNSPAALERPISLFSGES